MFLNCRIYKSMSMKDFMDMCAFVFAKGGYYVTGHIQNMNYEMTLERMKNKTTDELQKYFLNNVMKHIKLTELDIKVEETERFYEVRMIV